MKKITTLIVLFVLLSLNLNAQSFNQGFEAGIPGSWTSANITTSSTAHTGLTSAMTNNYLSGSFFGFPFVYGDGDFKTQTFTLTNPTSSTFSFWVRANNTNFLTIASMNVIIEDVDNPANDVIISAINVRSSAGTTWRQYTYSFSSVLAGNKKINFDWRTRENTIFFDDISVVIVPPLPITLVHFYGERKNNETLLYWSTLSEKNNKEFVVESSIDGINFQNLTKVDGNNNSSDIINYKIATHSKAVYFRLKQIDYDNTETIYNIIYVALENDEILLYPNVLNIGDSFNLYNLKKETLLSIFDNKGNVIYSDYVIDGIQNINFKNSGIYIVKIIHEDGIFYDKILIF